MKKFTSSSRGSKGAGEGFMNVPPPSGDQITNARTGTSSLAIAAACGLGWGHGRVFDGAALARCSGPLLVALRFGTDVGLGGLGLWPGLIG